MVATRKQNKDAHPGYVDRSSDPSRTTAATSSTQPAAKDRQLVIQKVAEAEDELLASQQQKLASARQPSRPGMAKKPRAVAKTALNPASTKNTDGTYTVTC